MYLFILLGTRGDDGAGPGPLGGGGYGLLQIFNNKFCRNSLRFSVSCGIMKPRKSCCERRRRKTGMTQKIVYWFDEKTGAYVELAGTEWDGQLSDEELLLKAREIAKQVGMDLSYGNIVIETVEEEA